MHQAELPEELINPTQTTGHRSDELVPESEHVTDSELVPGSEFVSHSELVPESPTEWTSIGDDSSA